MKKIRRLIILTFLSILFSLTTIGCSKDNKIQQSYNSYKGSWINKDYKAMYDKLSSKSKEQITEEEFIKRYTNIYSAINANDIKIEENGEVVKGENGVEVPSLITINTLAGDIKLDDLKINLVKEDKEFKIQWNEGLILPGMISGDKVRVDKFNAKRGSIYDRDNKPLAVDGIVKSIEIYPRKFEEGKEEKISKLAEILDISEDTIKDKLDVNKNPEHAVPIVNVLESNKEKINEVLKIQGIMVNDKQSRVYYGGESIGSLVGYIAPITAEELEKNQDKGYTATSKIGKAGLEKVYEDILRGSNGGEIYLERGKEKIDILKKEAIDGKDIKLSINLALQEKVYDSMDREKGAASAVDPLTGEVIALVSSPSYDPNTFVTYTTKAQKDLWEKSEKAEFHNRFNDIYSPGSTMKLLTAAIGLDNGIIDPNKAVDIKGESWQKDSTWGNYKVTRVMDPGKSVTLKDAVKYSDNIYFAQVALNLGTEKFVSGIKNFGIGEEMKFGYPMEKSQISNSNNEIKDEIALADTGYGQGQILVSPLNISLAYSAIVNKGNIMQPRLVISENNEAKVWKEAIHQDKLSTLINAFSAAVNDSDGTAKDAKVSGFNIAGKTGTAEIKKSQDDNAGTENGWFVAVNTDNPKISISMIIEDVKGRGGSHFVVPKVQKVMEYYLNAK